MMQIAKRSVSINTLVPYAKIDTDAHTTKVVKVATKMGVAPLFFAATPGGEGNNRVIGTDHYNGKIDRPRLTAKVLGEADIQRLAGDAIPHDLNNSIVGAWDFSRELSSERLSIFLPIACTAKLLISLLAR